MFALTTRQEAAAVIDEFHTRHTAYLDSIRSVYYSPLLGHHLAVLDGTPEGETVAWLAAHPDWELVYERKPGG